MKTKKIIQGVFTVLFILAMVFAACKQPHETNPPTLKKITAVYNGEAVTPDVQLDTLKIDLIVTAEYSNNTTQKIDEKDYTLSGTLAAPTSEITVTYKKKKTAFIVTVKTAASNDCACTGAEDCDCGVDCDCADCSAPAVTLSSIMADYTGPATIYTSTLLDSLKTNLTVTAKYSNGTEKMVKAEDYTLGDTTLTTGLNEITVTYQKKTDTFIVIGMAYLTHIIAVYNGTATIYTYTPRDNLKNNLIVTAYYSDDTEEIIDAGNYTLDGTLAAPTSEITVRYGGKTDTFTVNVTAVTLSSITANYTQSGVVYTSTPLNNLKNNLIVTAYYSNSTEQMVAAKDYTLSGTLTVGTSTVNVNYEGQNGSFTVNVHANLSIAMVLIGNSSFEMGKNLGNGGGGDVTPTHQVTLTENFYMGKYEVTQAQYESVMGALPENLTKKNYGKGDNYPVYYVSWYDAIVFCNKLSMMEGLTPAYSISGGTNPADWGGVPRSNNGTWNAVVCDWNADGYRLPTEAQWEYAAKGGNTGEEFTYAGSDTIGNVAWYTNNSGSTTHEVGTKSPNGLGLYDMAGNVTEWCWDWYGNYTNGAVVDPKGAAPGNSRVWRDGGFFAGALFCRSVYRGSDFPSYWDDYDQGFRVSRPAP